MPNLSLAQERLTMCIQSTTSCSLLSHSVQEQIEAVLSSMISSCRGYSIWSESSESHKICLSNIGELFMSSKNPEELSNFQSNHNESFMAFSSCSKNPE